MNTKTLVLLLSLYSLACGIKPPSDKEIAQAKAQSDSVRRADATFNARKDTLSVVLRQNPVHEYNAVHSNKVYLTGETLDGKLKRLIFRGNYISGVVASALRQGDTLSFLIPKDVLSTDRMDSTSQEYFLGGLNYLISINSKPFPK